MTTTVLAYLPSPSQGVWHLFGVIPLRAYALCIIVGIVAALLIGDRRWVARGGEQGVIYDIALWAVPFGLIGGRLYHVMTDWQKYFGADGAGFFAALRIWDGGLGIWGAVALGGVGAWIACRRRDIPLPAFGDAIAPGIILAQAIGRLGNYFNQELYGRETDLPWGLTIWERLDPSGVVSPHSLDGVSTGQVYAVVHPTFLYELIWNVLIFALLIWVDRRFTIGHGRLFALYVAGYCVGRFWVELMRSDTATLIAGIRINTFTSMFVFIAAVVYLMIAPKGREDPATLGGTGDAADGDPDSALDGVGRELAAVAATSGVVAAAKAAGDDGTSASGADSASTPGSSGADERREASLGSTDDDEAAVDAAEDPATDGVAEAADVPAVALEGTEVAEALNAEPEPEADVTASAPEEGLGSVDGGEVAEAQDDATLVHAAAVVGADDAEALAGDVAAEPAEAEDRGQPVDGLGSVDGGEVAAAEGDAEAVHAAALESAAAADAAAGDVATEPDETTDGDTNENAAETEPPVAVQADATAVAPEDGLGSVDGDEVAEAQDDAAEVNAAAVTAADNVTALAENAAAEDVAAKPDETTDGNTTKNAAEPEPEVAAQADATAVAPEDGLGSVDGDEVAAAEGDAEAVHAAALESTAAAEGAAEDVAAEPDEATEGVAAEGVTAAEVEPEPEVAAQADAAAVAPEDGLGSVDGDEVAEAQDDAAKGNAAAVTEPDETTEGVAAEGVTAAVAPEDGLGSVDGDEVAEAQDDVAEVNAAAVTGADDATALAENAAADDVATEPDETTEGVAAEGVTAAEVKPESEAAAEPDAAAAAAEDGLGSVDGDEGAAADGDAEAVHAATLESEAAAEGTTDGDTNDNAVEPEPEVDAEPDAAVVAPEDGLGSVDGDEIAEAQGEAADGDESLAGDVTAKDDPDGAAETATDDPKPTTPTRTPPRRRRWWSRR